jgi:hypothetical protein
MTRVRLPDIRGLLPGRVLGGAPSSSQGLSTGTPQVARRHREGRPDGPGRLASTMTIAMLVGMGRAASGLPGGCPGIRRSSGDKPLRRRNNKLMTRRDRSEQDAGLEALFEPPPVAEVRTPCTSAAAVTAFVSGLTAALAALFTLTSGLALLLGLVATVAGAVGMNVTSRPHLTGRVLVPIGVLLGLVALVLVCLRYAQVHGAFGDDALPVVADVLQRLNTVLRIP